MKRGIYWTTCLWVFSGNFAHAQVGSPAGPVPVERLQARRADLLAKLGNGIAIIPSAQVKSIEGDYPQDSDYREHNDFFYLTGLEAPGAWSCAHRSDTHARSSP